MPSSATQPQIPAAVPTNETGNSGGVIWLTGYSAAGKTSIARIVASAINQAGTPAIHLDGDDLRAILGNKWGYSAEERLELAHVYFRLCSHLSSHKVTVVISAVAMYGEIYAWFKQNVPRAMLVYLDVPEATRRQRDAATKGVYRQASAAVDHYQVPTAADMVLQNLDGADVHALAAQVVARFSSLLRNEADRGKSDYWNTFYAKRSGVLEPSPFATYVRGLIDAAAQGPAHLVEVGCGNGRDSAFFARTGCTVTALDTSQAAITACRDVHGAAARFQVGALSQTRPAVPPADVVYCRFVLHAMTPEEEGQFLAAAAAVLKPGGRLFVEARSINDPLARKGEVLSPTERIEGHYRRFIIADELQQKVAAVGLRIDSMIESNGLARFGDEDPVVIRMIATRPAAAAAAAP